MPPDAGSWGLPGELACPGARNGSGWRHKLAGRVARGDVRAAGRPAAARRGDPDRWGRHAHGTGRPGALWGGVWAGHFHRRGGNRRRKPDPGWPWGCGEGRHRPAGSESPQLGCSSGAGFGDGRAFRASRGQWRGPGADRCRAQPSARENGGGPQPADAEGAFRVAAGLGRTAVTRGGPLRPAFSAAPREPSRRTGVATRHPAQA